MEANDTTNAVKESEMLLPLKDLDLSQGSSDESASLRSRVDDAGEDSDDKAHGVSQFFRKLKHKATSPAHELHKMFQSNEEAPNLSPHRNDTAYLRRENRLSPEELRFLAARRSKIARGKALRNVLGLSEDEAVDERDVPMIGLGGSGGGMRANLGFLSTILAFQELGLWPLVTYAAGVSGSCWALASLYTLPLSPPLVSPLSAGPVIEHFMQASGVHPLSTKSVNRVSEAEGGYQALLGPLISKSKHGQEVCMIDLYSTLVSSYFWMIHGADRKDRIDPASMKWSRAYENGELADGCEPFPILTACRHERPWRSWKSAKDRPDEEDDEIAEHGKRDAWWQWFEINPIEVGCEELQGWVPTWSFGRKFEEGASVQCLPEHSLALLLGSATAAPAAPLSSFLETLWRNLPRNIFGSALRHILLSLSRRMGDSTMDKLDNINPVHASNEANPFYNAKKEKGRGNGFENSPRLHLVDSGMSNNCPTHVFLHPARDVDLIILFDASSDVQKGAALARINEYGATKGLEFTPRVKLPALTPARLDKEGKPVPIKADEMRKKFDGSAQLLDGKALHVVEGKEGITYNDKHQPQAWRDVTLVYIPLLPNACNPTYDPSTAPFSSSYNLVWTPENVATILKTATQNIRDGQSVLKQAIRETYEKRKALRLAGHSYPIEKARFNIANEATEGPLVIYGKSSVELAMDELEASGKRPWMSA